MSFRDFLRMTTTMTTMTIDEHEVKRVSKQVMGTTVAWLKAKVISPPHRERYSIKHHESWVSRVENVLPSIYHGLFPPV